MPPRPIPPSLPKIKILTLPGTPSWSRPCPCSVLPLLLFEAGTDPGKQSKCPTEATVLSVKCWDTHRNLEIYQWDIQFNGIH